jgi:hypothetical protein
MTNSINNRDYNPMDYSWGFLGVAYVPPEMRTEDYRRTCARMRLFVKLSFVLTPILTILACWILS